MSTHGQATDGSQGKGRDAIHPSPVLPPVISVVGKSGTGKTTLLEKLLPQLKDRGLRVGVLKHHHHPSSFDTPGKDTYRLADAGAEVVAGVSPVQVAIFRREDNSGDLDDVIARTFEGMDLVLTEGHKRGPYPKVEVQRAARSLELLCDPAELLALVTDTPLQDLAAPQVDLNDVPRLCELVVAYVESKR